MFYANEVRPGLNVWGKSIMSLEVGGLSQKVWSQKGGEASESLTPAKRNPAANSRKSPCLVALGTATKEAQNCILAVRKTRKASC